MHIGRVDEYDISRLLLYFSMSQVPKDVDIESATLTFYIKRASSWHKNEITPYVISEEWSPERVTWNTMPLYDRNTYDYTPNSWQPALYEFDITNIVQNWYNGDLTNFGLIFIGQESIDCTYLKVLTDLKHICSPRVTVTYFKKSCSGSTRFVEEMQELDTCDTFNYALQNDTSLTKTVTYMVENTGFSAVTVKLQISPNGLVFADDYKDVIIQPGDITYLTPYIFAKYTRIGIMNINTGDTSSVKVWYQAQI